MVKKMKIDIYYNFPEDEAVRLGYVEPMTAIIYLNGKPYDYVNSNELSDILDELYNNYPITEIHNH